MNSFLKPQEGPNSNAFYGGVCKFGTYIAFTILFFYYGYKVETVNTVTCYADDSNTPVPQGTAKSTDVSKDFNTLIMLYAYTSLIDTIREIFEVAYYKTRTAAFLKIRNILSLCHIVQFAALVMSHVYRLRHAGKVCSGDYLTS